MSTVYLWRKRGGADNGDGVSRNCAQAGPRSGSMLQRAEYGTLLTYRLDF